MLLKFTGLLIYYKETFSFRYTSELKDLSIDFNCKKGMLQNKNQIPV